MSERPSTVVGKERPPRIASIAALCSGEAYSGVPPRLRGWARRASSGRPRQVEIEKHRLAIAR